MTRFWQKKWGNIRRALDRLSYIGRASGVLVYVGANRGHGLRRIAHRYAQVYAFEPNPVCFAEAQQRLRFFRNITLVNAACSVKAGTATLFISNNQGVASSLSALRDDNIWQTDNGLAVERAIEVPTINLSDFLHEKGITSIAMYVSDIQEHDLNVLETMRSWIDAGKIDQVLVEINASAQTTQYHDAPDNTLERAKSILAARYDMIASGAGELTEGQFTPPETATFLDTLWRLRP